MVCRSSSRSRLGVPHPGQAAESSWVATDIPTRPGDRLTWSRAAEEEWQVIRSLNPPPVSGWEAGATGSEPTASMAVADGLDACAELGAAAAMAAVAWSTARSGPGGTLFGVTGYSPAARWAGASVVWCSGTVGSLEAAADAAVCRRLAA